MLRVNVERMIGELTMAVGMSIPFTSASVLWDLADDFMTRPFWSVLLLVFGASIMYGAVKMGRRFRIGMMLLALLAWGTMLTLYAVLVQPTPMMFVSLIVIYHACERLRELWSQ